MDEDALGPYQEVFIDEYGLAYRVMLDEESIQSHHYLQESHVCTRCIGSSED